MPSVASPLDRGAWDFPGGQGFCTSNAGDVGSPSGGKVPHVLLFGQKKIDRGKGLPDSPQNALPHMVILLSINKYLCVCVY